MADQIPIDSLEECRLYRFKMDFVAEFKGIEKTDKGYVLVLHERFAGIVRIPTKLGPDIERA